MGSSEPRLVKSQTEVSILSCKTGRSLGCSWHFGNLGVLEGQDLPLPLFLYDDQGGTGLDFAHFIAFLELHVRSGECNGDVGTHKANAPQRETGVTAFVDRVKDYPVRGFDGGSPVQLSAKDVDEVGIVCKQRAAMFTLSYRFHAPSTKN